MGDSAAQLGDVWMVFAIDEKGDAKMKKETTGGEAFVTLLGMATVWTFVWWLLREVGHPYPWYICMFGVTGTIWMLRSVRSALR